MVADTFWPHSAPRMTIQTAPFESTDRFMTKHKSTTAPSPSTSRSSFDYNTTREPMLSAFRGMFSAIKTVFCMGYFQAILTVLFIPLLGLKCFVGYVLVRYARHRYIAVQSRFRERSASRPATDDIGVSYGGSVSSNNSKRRPPLFVPSTVSAVSAHPQHYSSARFVGSVPSSPANYSVVRRNIGISSRATDTTQTTNSPLHRESSTVMMDNVAYGNEDPRSVSSSVVASPIAKLPGSVEFQRANTPGRRDSQSLKVEEIAGEEGLHAEETAFIGGTFKVDDPQAVPVSLDTIDRYMLYKSRIP